LKPTQVGSPVEFSRRRPAAYFSAKYFLPLSFTLKNNKKTVVVSDWRIYFLTPISCGIFKCIKRLSFCVWILWMKRRKTRRFKVYKNGEFYGEMNRCV